MDVRRRLVSSTHAWIGRWSKRTEISSNVEVIIVWGQPRWLLRICSHPFDIRGCFSLGFPVDSLGAAVALVSGISGLAVFLVAITFGRSGTSVTGWGEGFGFFLVDCVMVALTTRPFGQRDITPLPGPSARQRDRTAELSEQQCSLCRRSFGHARVSGSLPLTILSKSSSPCCFPRSHSTEGVPVG